MHYIHVHTSLVNQALWNKAGSYNSQLEGHNCIKVFYYLKLKDSNGSGFADVTIKELEEIFSRSGWSIRRWIKSGKKLGIFRGVIKLKKGFYRIYYASVIKVCKKFEIKHLGEITELKIDQLKNIKFHATEANAIGAQNKSLHAATEGKKKLIRNTLSAEKLCCKSKRILFLSDRFIYVNPKYLMYGASQEYIAKQSGYHKSTIQRRLSDSYRKAHGLKPVIKKQQCIRLDKDKSRESILEAKEAALFGDESNVLFHNDKFKDLAFKPYTNIYYIPEEEIQLRKQRYLRAKLNREWDKENEKKSNDKQNKTQKKSRRRIGGYNKNLSIKNSKNYILRQISKSSRIKLLDWIKELKFTSFSQEFKNFLDNYLANTESSEQVNPPPGGRVI